MSPGIVRYPSAALRAGRGPTLRFGRCQPVSDLGGVSPRLLASSVGLAEPPVGVPGSSREFAERSGKFRRLSVESPGRSGEVPDRCVESCEPSVDVYERCAGVRGNARRRSYLRSPADAGRHFVATWPGRCVACSFLGGDVSVGGGFDRRRRARRPDGTFGRRPRGDRRYIRTSATGGPTLRSDVGHGGTDGTFGRRPRGDRRCVRGVPTNPVQNPSDAQLP